MRSAIIAAGLVAVASAGVSTVTSTEDVTITSCGPQVTDCPANVEWENWSTTTTEKKDDPSSTWASWDPKPTETKASSTETWSEWDPKSTSTSTETWSEWDPKSTLTSSETWAAWSSKAADASSTGTWAAWSSKSADASSTGTWAAWTSAAATTAAPCPSYTAMGPPEWFSLLPSSVLSSVAAKWTGAPPADWCYYSYSSTAVKTSTVAVVPTPASSATWAAWSGTGKAPAGAASSSGSWAAWSASSTGPAIAKFTGAANANTGSMAVAGLAGLAALIIA